MAARVLEVTEPVPLAVTPDSVAAAAVPVLTSGRNGSLPEAAAASDGVTDVDGLISWGAVVVGAAAVVTAGGAVWVASVPPSMGRTTSSPTISRSTATSAATSSSCRGPPAVTWGWVAMGCVTSPARPGWPGPPAPPACSTCRWAAPTGTRSGRCFR